MTLMQRHCDEYFLSFDVPSKSNKILVAIFFIVHSKSHRAQIFQKQIQMKW